jgi:hypothetical protein
MTPAKLLELIGGPTILIFIGGIIAAVGAVWAAIDQNKSSKKLEQKSEEIADLNREIINLSTGGSSYAYLTLGFIPQDTDFCPLTVQQSGAYPVHDVYIRIVDLTVRNYSMSHYPRYQVTDDPDSDIAVVRAEDVGTIGPGQKRVLPGLDLGLPKIIDPEDAEEYRGRRDFKVEVTAKNGTVIQQFRFRKNALTGEWKVATRREHAGDIEEKIPNDFRDKNGGFEW